MIAQPKVPNRIRGFQLRRGPKVRVSNRGAERCKAPTWRIRMHAYRASWVCSPSPMIAVTMFATECPGRPRCPGTRCFLRAQGYRASARAVGRGRSSRAPTETSRGSSGYGKARHLDTPRGGVPEIDQQVVGFRAPRSWRSPRAGEDLTVTSTWQVATGKHLIPLARSDVLLGFICLIYFPSSGLAKVGVASSSLVSRSISFF
jgi:hypothetical protein